MARGETRPDSVTLLNITHRDNSASYKNMVPSVAMMSK